MRLLFEIEDVFAIQGRGCVLVPGVPNDFPISVKVGATIVIEPPAGRAIETTIAAFEMINRGRKVEHAAFSIARSINKNEIPVGSRVFLREKALVEYEMVRIRK